MKERISTRTERISIGTYTFEIDVEEIKKSKKVLLDLPDGLKMYGEEIVKKIKDINPEIEIVFSLRNSFGACDHSVKEAEIIGADLLIHIGHSPFIK